MTRLGSPVVKTTDSCLSQNFRFAAEVGKHVYYLTLRQHTTHLYSPTRPSDSIINDPSMVTAPHTPQTPSPVLGSPIAPFGSALSATPTVVNDEGSSSPVSKTSHGSESDKLDAIFRIHDLLVNDA